MKFYSFILKTISLFLLVCQASGAVLYVNLSNDTPVPPYASWASAATDIQSAVDAAHAGDLILVTNGVYNTGGRVINYSGSTTNRVVVSQAVMIQSVNGPSATVIQGYQVPGTVNGSTAIRCVGLASYAVLSGFTLTGGATATNESGGGIYCQGGNTITNCVILGNASGSGGGGGAYGGPSVNFFNCNIGSNSTAGNGGGINCGNFDLINNCVISANSCHGNDGGGGVHASFNSGFDNCTIANNYSDGGPGGSYQGQLTNCIIYNNTSGNSFVTDNTSQSMAVNCCTIPTNHLSGISNHNLTNSPGFFNGDGGDFRLAPWSVCLDKGVTNGSIGNVDLAGNPRTIGGIVDIGAYEYQQDFTQTIHYVRLPNSLLPNSYTNAVAPYTNWTAAATNIQSAIDVATAGDFIVVSNGTYNIGGRTVYGHVTNRVTLDKAVTLLSLAGSKYTAIAGTYSGVRCAYLTNGASIIGFTLTNGGARFSGDSLTNQSGGGAWCESPLATLSNCVITACSAANFGGGIYSGTLVGCTISNNNASVGGGSAWGTLQNCILTGNTAGTAGGGTFSSILSNCTLTNNGTIYFSGNLYGGGSAGGYLTNCVLLKNIAQYGGGACSNILVNCYLNGNWVTNTGRPGAGGATYASALTNCLLSGNAATNGNGGGAIYGTLAGCMLTNNFAVNGGGACSNNLNNCTLYTNSASGTGGGSYYAKLTNCLLIQNSAPYGGGAAFGITYQCLFTNNGGVSGSAVYANTAIGCTLNSHFAFASYASRLSRCTYNYSGASYDDVLDNCEFLHYSYTKSSSIFPQVASGSVLNNCTILFVNNPLNGAQNPATSGCLATNSIIYGNAYYADNSGYYSHCCISFYAPGIANFTNSPYQFLDGSLHLVTNSIFIDAGDNSAATGLMDFDGRPRLVGSAVDIGATEFQGASAEPFISWLAQYNLPDDGSADAADSDGDGMSNWQEWLTDTSPTNALSVLRMAPPILVNSPNGVVLTWQSSTNRNYYLQRSSDLTAGFSAIQSNIIGQASVTSFIDFTATNDGSYFYRVGVQ